MSDETRPTVDGEPVDHSMWARPNGPNPDALSPSQDSPAAPVGEGATTILPRVSPTAAPHGADPDDAGPDDAEPAPRGRRFIQDDEPAAPAPEATAATEPAPAAARRSFTEDGDASASAAGDAATPSRGFHLPSGRKGLALLAILGLVAATAVGGGVYALASAFLGKPASVTTRTIAPSSVAPTVVEAQLITDADAALIDKKAGWKISATADKVDQNSPQPQCLPLNIEGAPLPASTKLRTLTSASANQLAALHQIDGYATSSDAAKAFALRKQALGSCGVVPSHIVRAWDVKGLGDEAVAVQIALQEKTLTYHTIVLNRTGTVVNVVDVAQDKKGVGAERVARAVRESTERECKPAEGTCPTGTEVTESAPPLAGLAGWLVEADLPRITPGNGLWTTTPPVKEISATTGCENMTLATVDGPKKRRQRSYLLTQDSAAPKDFGVDEVVLTFGSKKQAATFVETLSDNINKCPSTVLTAKVPRAEKLDQDLGDVTMKGVAYTVTQQTAPGKSRVFRVSTVVVGKKVLYLRATPTEKFDFTDEAWDALTRRAAERATQQG